MSAGMTCDYFGCSNPIQLRCDRCRDAFCVRHIHSRHEYVGWVDTVGRDKYGDSILEYNDRVEPRVTCQRCHEQDVLRQQADAAERQRLAAEALVKSNTAADGPSEGKLSLTRSKIMLVSLPAISALTIFGWRVTILMDELGVDESSNASVVAFVWSMAAFVLFIAVTWITLYAINDH